MTGLRQQHVTELLSYSDTQPAFIGSKTL